MTVRRVRSAVPELAAERSTAAEDRTDGKIPAGGAPNGPTTRVAGGREGSGRSGRARRVHAAGPGNPCLPSPGVGGGGDEGGCSVYGAVVDRLARAQRDKSYRGESRGRGSGPCHRRRAARRAALWGNCCLDVASRRVSMAPNGRDEPAAPAASEVASNPCNRRYDSNASR